MNAINELRNRDYSVGGMISREVREKGTRIGFEIADLNSDRRGWLSHIDQPTGPQVGKYRVNLTDLNQIGVKAIQDALKIADIVVIDEIGPMELSSITFKQAIKDALNENKLVLGVVHHSARDSVIDSIRKRSDAEIIEVNTGNRESLHNTIIQKALEFLVEEKQVKRNGS